MRKIILIAGPSGAGKTTISEYLTTCYGIPRVVTHTTRPARVGETPGVSYYFETPESMSQLHLFEKVTYGGNQYGSSREGLDRAWEKSDLVSLIVDIAGARSYLEALGDQVYFLYVTGDLATLKERMLARGDDPEKVAGRLAGAELNELPADLAPQAHVLVNQNLTKTEEKLDEIVKKLRD